MAIGKSSAASVNSHKAGSSHHASTLTGYNMGPEKSTASGTSHAFSQPHHPSDCKVGIVTGKTGVGKSRLIGNYVVDGPRPQVGNSLLPETSKTVPYTCRVGGHDVVLYDTPGGGDTRGRDQDFLNGVLAAMQRNSSGIHRVYYCVDARECKFDESQRQFLSLVVALLGGPENIQEGTFYLCLTKCDRVQPEEMWPPEEYKRVVSEFLPELRLGVVCSGGGGMGNFEARVGGGGGGNVIQTEGMRQVQKLRMECVAAERAMREAEEERARGRVEAERMREEMERREVEHKKELEQQQEVFRIELAKKAKDVESLYRLAQQAEEARRELGKREGQLICKLEEELVYIKDKLKKSKQRSRREKAGASDACSGVDDNADSQLPRPSPGAIEPQVARRTATEASGPSWRWKERPPHEKEHPWEDQEWVESKDGSLLQPRLSREPEIELWVAKGRAAEVEKASLCKAMEVAETEKEALRVEKERAEAKLELVCVEKECVEAEREKLRLAKVRAERERETMRGAKEKAEGEVKHLHTDIRKARKLLEIEMAQWEAALHHKMLVLLGILEKHLGPGHLVTQAVQWELGFY